MQNLIERALWAATVVSSVAVISLLAFFSPDSLKPWGDE
jgi:hypothetical protein